jgi:hypothetical protein
METNLTPMARTKATTEAKSKKAKAGSGTKRKTAATKVKEGVAAETAAGEPVVKRGRARPCKVQPVSAPVPESNAIGAAEGSGTSKEISDGYEKPQPEPETAPAPKSVEEKRRARFRPKWVNNSDRT